MVPLGQCRVANQDHSNGITSDISLALIPGGCFCISRLFSVPLSSLRKPRSCYQQLPWPHLRRPNCSQFILPCHLATRVGWILDLRATEERMQKLIYHIIINNKTSHKYSHLFVTILSHKLITRGCNTNPLIFLLHITLVFYGRLHKMFFVLLQLQDFLFLMCILLLTLQSLQNLIVHCKMQCNALHHSD